ncbi:MAG TPA: class I SAM-dependent methyltransferase [Stellaceae bacterium]|nr:class I SAM-dependent methyltransferase [Stellaceae bacterium]
MMDGGAARLAPKSCPVCGGDGAHFTTHNGFDLYSCGICGTIYIHPMPTGEFLAEFYQDRHPYYIDKAAKKLRRARGRVRGMKLFARRGGKFLDIGCNAGFMVEAAREGGFTANGIDLDADAVTYAREHFSANAYHVGPVEGLVTEHAGQFALIHSADVIEHVPDARGFAAAIFSLLRPGGYVHLTTPDITHWRRPRELTAWDGFIPPNHLIYYNPASLKRLLRDAGFQIVYRKPTLKPRIVLMARRPLS